MIDFWGVGFDVAERMGLLPELHGHAYPIEQLRLVSPEGRSIAAIDVTQLRLALNDRWISLLRW